MNFEWLHKLFSLRESRWIDHAIIGLMAFLAIFSMGQSIAQPNTAIFLMVIAVIGLAISYGMMVWKKVASFKRFDSLVLVLVTSISVICQRQLNNLLPTGPLDSELWACGFLSWTLCLSCFGLWRDQSKLFVVVPSIAIFGLIGVYNTYHPAVILFFVFLFLLALLFGRIHSRAMIRLAYESGYQSSSDTKVLSNETIEQDFAIHEMRRGVWKWMAGPEWAMSSAGVVILLSLLWAPTIQQSVQSIAGSLAVAVPKVHVQRESTNRQLPLTSQSAVGNGPVSLSNHIDGVAFLDKPRYLMVMTYSTFVGKSWAATNLHELESRSEGGWFTNQPSPLSLKYKELIEQIKEPIQLPFMVQLTDLSTTGTPVPEFVTQVSTPPGVIISGEGRLLNVTKSQGSTLVTGYFTSSQITPGDPSYPDTLEAFPNQMVVKTTERVRDLTLQAIKGKKTDWDKAKAIEQAIDRRCQYNLNAPAVPIGKDPVDYFLFVSHQGYCDLFATAMAQMAKIAGIDSRYAVGFLTSADDRGANGGYLLRDNKMHAWAELKFHGLGWVPFDATANALDVTPSSGQEIMQLINAVGIIALALLVAFCCYMVFIKRKWLKGRAPEKKTKVAPILAVDHLYDRFSRKLEYLSGQKRPLFMAPKAWMESVENKIGSARHQAIEINETFIQMFYGPSEITQDKVAGLRKLLKKFCKQKKEIQTPPSGHLNIERL